MSLGRWGGSDPLLRTLRVVSVVAMIGLVVVVATDPVRSQNVPLAGLLVGAILLQLGYEVSLPGVVDRRKHDDPPPNGEDRRRRS